MPNIEEIRTSCSELLKYRDVSDATGQFSAVNKTGIMYRLGLLRLHPWGNMYEWHTALIEHGNVAGPKSTWRDVMWVSLRSMHFSVSVWYNCCD